MKPIPMLKRVLGYGTRAPVFYGICGANRRKQFFTNIYRKPVLLLQTSPKSPETSGSFRENVI